MIALEITVTSLALGNLACPLILYRLLSARQAAPEATAELPPLSRQPVIPATASGQQDAPRVFEPDARPTPRNQLGRFASARQAGNGAGATS